MVAQDTNPDFATLFQGCESGFPIKALGNNGSLYESGVPQGSVPIFSISWYSLSETAFPG